VRTRRRAAAAPRKYGARFFVDGVNLGDGKRIACWLRIARGMVEVRRVRARRAWRLPLADAAGVIARAAQVREARP
jgi:hypothetical protein